MKNEPWWLQSPDVFFFDDINMSRWIFRICRWIFRIKSSSNVIFFSKRDGMMECRTLRFIFFFFIIMVKVIIHLDLWWRRKE